MADYDSMERPVEDEGEALNLTFGVTLQQIIDVVSVVSCKFFFFIISNSITGQSKRQGKIPIFKCNYSLG